MGVIYRFFISGGAIFTFFEMIARKVVIKGLIVPIQILMLLSFFTVRMAIVSLLFTLSLDIFDKLHELSDLFNKLPSEYPDIFEMPFTLLSNLGFFQALEEHLPLFSIVMMSFFTVIIAKLFLNTIKDFSTLIFQIGSITTT